MKRIPLILNHLGAAVAILAVALGNSGMHRVQLADSGMEAMVDPWAPWVLVGLLILVAGLLFRIILSVVRQPVPKVYAPVLGGVILAAALFLWLTLSATGPFADNPNPALRSRWFAPHVIVYMLSYALLCAATVLAVFRKLSITDNLVYAGLVLLTVGMLLGALWAREAWGTYWSWDPKETLALVTWFFYAVYVHFRAMRPNAHKKACALLAAGFICLQMCWWGVNLFPSVREQSVHTYNVR